MNILIIATGLPFPPDHGRRIRLFNLYSSINSENKVFWTCINEKTSQEFVRKSQEMFDGVYTHNKKNRAILIEKIINKFLAYPRINGFDKLIKSIIKIEKIDLIIIDSEHMAIYSPKILGKIPIILNTHNMPGLVEFRSFKSAKNIKLKIRYLYRYLKIYRFFNKYSQKFDLITMCSQQEIDLIQKKYKNTKFHLIPNGVDIKNIIEIKTKFTTYDEKCLVFIGPFDYHPNFDAIFYFCEIIFPLILKKDPLIKLKLMGKETESFGNNYFPHLPIIGFGFVDNPLEQIINSKILITPFRIGAGTRIKILESIALGKPVVSTTIGAEGIDIDEIGGLFRVDNPLDFSEKVLELINFPKEKYSNLCLYGQEIIKNQYNWDIARSEVQKIILSFNQNSV
jgi:glycosyltransferase involved in cell wall biosynthesis